MREIPLGRGLVALVDDADYDRVMAAGPWCARRSGPRTYAQHHVRRAGRRAATESLHTFLTGWPYIDHRNGDGLDNQRRNLRPATGTQNNANTRRRTDNTSGFKGVSWRPDANRWHARVQSGRKLRHLGYFDTAEAAARAYDAAARELFGEFARPNFPEEISA